MESAPPKISPGITRRDDDRTQRLDRLTFAFVPGALQVGEPRLEVLDQCPQADVGNQRQVRSSCRLRRSIRRPGRRY